MLIHGFHILPAFDIVMDDCIATTSLREKMNTMKKFDKRQRVKLQNRSQVKKNRKSNHKSRLFAKKTMRHAFYYTDSQKNFRNSTGWSQSEQQLFYKHFTGKAAIGSNLTIKSIITA